MEVFFCLSGFLIASIILSKYRGPKGFDLQSYFINRVLRIWPAYFFAYGLILAVTFAGGEHFIYGEWRANQPASFLGLATPLLFVQNIEMAWGAERASYVELFDHSWSVALEEQFYLLTPLLVLVLSRRTRSFVATVLAALVLLSLIQRANNQSIWLLTSRLDPFVFGITLFLLYSEVRRTRDERVHRQSARATVALILGSVVLLLPAIISTYSRIPVKEEYGRFLAKTAFEPIFLFAALAVGLLGYVVFGDRRSLLHRLLRLRPFRALGEISYSTYLLHVPVVYYVCPAVAKALALGPSATIAISGPTVVLLAFCSNRLVERPFMAMRRKTELRRSWRLKSDTAPA